MLFGSNAMGHKAVWVGKKVFGMGVFHGQAVSRAGLEVSQSALRGDLGCLLAWHASHTATQPNHGAGPTPEAVFFCLGWLVSRPVTDPLCVVPTEGMGAGTTS